MDADVALADCALDEWAKWAVERLNGWPIRTLLARLMEEGITGAAHLSHAPMVLMPEHVAATDRGVTVLDIYEREAIIVYYLTYQDSALKAKQCGCSRATFFRRVERGQKNVARYLLLETQPDRFRHAG